MLSVGTTTIDDEVCLKNRILFKKRFFRSAVSTSTRYLHTILLAKNCVFSVISGNKKKTASPPPPPHHHQQCDVVKS